MSKPQSIDEYDEALTNDCEQVLVTLLSGMGPWKKSVYLIGGLAPRYLIRRRPPEVPPHAGTGDVDLLVELAVLADTEAYRTLEANLDRTGFTRAPDGRGGFSSWQWQIHTDNGTPIRIEFLACDPKIGGGKLQLLPTKGNLSAINIPHSDLVFAFHDAKTVTADLLGGNGRATETLYYANIVSFVCLKAFAFDHRKEGKDGHDIAYCLEYYEGGLNAVADQFIAALTTEHGSVIEQALNIIRLRFCDDENGEGYPKDGPTLTAKFETPGDEAAPELRNARILRQREVSELCQAFLQSIASGRPTG